MSEAEKQAAVGSQPPEAPAGGAAGPEEGFDPGSRAVADALRLTFGVLKLVMICIVAVFIWSGFYTVEESEVAIQLRFGKIHGSGEDRVKEPRSFPYWKWPEPIDEVIKAPSSKVERYLNINSFWYEEKPGRSASQMYSTPQIPLRFAKEGYCLTASTSASRQLDTKLSSSGVSARSSAAGSDYNIAHTKWRLRYRISDPIQFVENLWDGREGSPGERIGWYPVEKLLRNVASDAVIVVSAHWDIDDLLWNRREAYRNEVEGKIKSRLEELAVGITIAGLDYIEQSPPIQVKRDFEQVQSADNNKRTLLNQAEGECKKILNQAEAKSKNLIPVAESESSMVVKAAEAEAAYIKEVLRKIDSSARERAKGSSDFESAYRKSYNELLAVTLDQLYQETLREVIEKADEVFVMPSTKDQPTEVRMQMSRDATLRPREAEKEKKK